MNWFLPILEKKSIKYSTYIVPNSQMVAQQIKSVHGVFENKVSVIENGFNPQIFHFADSCKRKILKDCNSI